ncbi:glycine--tRNA ligase subunit beta [Candidatus Desantisbacteria bacterium CG1_02_38_46]|uniref:Glycine--tRNA ligase beta subunit n=2 Tax=unclassified Candidatus Desantisiibacteriota TaxID=3106372 RepID=A0A2H9P9R5_9BACT|nr:MAG: glycine--tRNA ligase subunit beta [Candidatus Desantisbacteria bacterium CG1_02_38_46]PIZ15018.1 MAG: glycine--tRNA ligase subunit beta [Candidatus Desantisbacteria bacterium CG_4_10_14_0_8_um_filter_39_17]
MKVSASQKKNLLLEIGCEELPVSHQRCIREVYKSGPTLKNIAHGDVKVFTTPRRIIFFIENLDNKQDDVERQIFGPAKNVAFDAGGNPTKAAIGFARSLGIDAKNLKIEKRGNGDYACARVIEKGKDTYSYLCGYLKYFITQLTFPKSMRWNQSGMKFSRPIRWVLALYGDKVVKFNTSDLQSNKFTYGNRLVSTRKIEIEEADIEKYKEALKKAYVIVEHEERKKMIQKALIKLCKYPCEGAGRGSIAGQEFERVLIDEVADLVEYPHAIKGEFSPEYLHLPSELVMTCMMGHERFFPVVGQDGKLRPNFISIVNNPCLSKSVEDTIRQGNENVLSARLADAKFFYEQDKKEGLNTKLERLNDVIFQGGMGSLYDKIQRIEKLSLFIAEVLRLDEEMKKKIQRAAILSRIDTGNQVINEFPSLQGTMGKIYALEFGENGEVARAIEEQYLPRFELDMPGTIGAIIGIADKIDNICSFFAQGYVATGSEDPFGARRDAQGLIEVLMKVNDVSSVPIMDLVDKELSLITDKVTNKNAKDEIIIFLKQRIRTFFKTRSIEYDEADAVMEIALNKNLRTAVDRAKIIQEFRKRPDFEKFIIAFKRVVNILEQAKITVASCPPQRIWLGHDKLQVESELLQEKEEKKLYDIYLQVKDEVEDKVKNNNFKEAMEILLTNFGKPIDDFFDHVMVMTDDENLKENRLSLLCLIANLFFLIADFSKIVLSESLVEKK